MEKKTEKQKRSLAGAMDKAKSFAKNANELALTQTEAAITQSLEVTAQWQKVAEHAIKSGLKLSSKQQDLVFEILNEVKADIKEGKKRFSKLVA